MGRRFAMVAAIFVALSGCTTKEEAPPLVDESILEDLNETIVLPTLLLGLVLGPDGPIDANVWLETADLTTPVNNIQEYMATREDTLQSTVAGQFQIEGLENMTLAVRADGFIPWSGTVTVPANTSLELNITLTPWGTESVTAHRGGALYAPDNSLSALHKAGLLGVPRAEIDIQWTQDETFVLWHDGIIEDQTGNRIWMSTDADVTARDIGSEYDPSFANETVPTLAQALEVMALYGTTPVVEVKMTDDPRHAVMMQAAIDEIKASGLETVVISFDPTYDMQCGIGGLSCGYIEGYPQNQRTDPAGIGNDVMGSLLTEHHMPKELATAEYVAESQGLGLSVTAWTVNDVQEAMDLYAAGVDMITTDMPWEIMQALAV